MAAYRVASFFIGLTLAVIIVSLHGWMSNKQVTENDVPPSSINKQYTNINTIFSDGLYGANRPWIQNYEDFYEKDYIFETTTSADSYFFTNIFKVFSKRPKND